MIIRPMSPVDLPQVLAIEKSSFTTPWSAGVFLREVAANRLAWYYVAWLDRRVVGYVGYWVTPDGAHITNIAVHPSFRRRGIGRRLLRHACRAAEKEGLLRAYLEVRATNIPARNLYSQEGFKEMDVKRGYYHDAKEDAIIMTRALGGEKHGRQ